jgi:hypothetical protein
MKTDPFNKKLHNLLIAKGFKYTEKVRYDRYDRNQVTIFYYASGYTMILDGAEPVSKEVKEKIMSAL